MRRKDTRSREITDIIGDIARNIRCEITVPGRYGDFTSAECPPVNYVFGNSQYVRERIIDLSKTASSSIIKYPLIALFVPISEQRGNPQWHSKAKVKVLIAIATKRDYSNEERSVISFANVLRPIYEAFLEGIRKDGRLEISYKGIIPHEYSENYSYGKYGAYTSPSETMPDPIDAIDINNLELTVKNNNCTSI